MKTFAVVAAPSSPAAFPVRTQVTLLACVGVGALAFLAAVDPHRHAVYPQCLFHQTTGLYCAGCGATRAAYALIHGQALQALQDNLLFTVAAPFLVYSILKGGLTAWRDNAWPVLEMNARRTLTQGLTGMAILLAFMVLRNLDGWPFALMRPV